MFKFLYVVLFFYGTNLAFAQDSKLTFDDIFMGIAVSDSVDYEEFNVKDPLTEGVTITSVLKESPCGSLIKGDVIYKIAGDDVKSMKDFDAAIAKFTEGKEVKIAYQRLLRKGNGYQKWTRKYETITPITLRTYFSRVLISENDEINNVQMFRRRDHDVLGRSNSVVFNIAMHEGIPTYVLRFQYFDIERQDLPDWLFMEKCILMVGDKVFEYDVPQSNHDNTDSRVWEWYDFVGNDELKKALSEWKLGEPIKARMVGRQTSVDVDVSGNEAHLLRLSTMIMLQKAVENSRSK